MYTFCLDCKEAENPTVAPTVFPARKPTLDDTNKEETYRTPMDDTQNGSRTIEENPSTQPPPNNDQPPNGIPEGTDPSGANQDEFTTLSLQLQALEKQKEILAKQLAVQQNALNRANQLAEAKRKVAAMQAEINRMEKECANTQTNHEQQPQQGPPSE